MDSLFGGSGIRTLRNMVRKGLIKQEDLDNPPSGWFYLWVMKEKMDQEDGSVQFVQKVVQPRQFLYINCQNIKMYLQVK